IFSRDWSSDVCSSDLIVLINVVLSGKFFRVDLTEEKRYTLAPVTKSFLSNLETDVFIRVYLDGELNPGFRKLARSSRETLEEFKIGRASCRECVGREG